MRVVRGFAPYSHTPFLSYSEFSSGSRSQWPLSPEILLFDEVLEVPPPSSSSFQPGLKVWIISSAFRSVV